MHIAANQCGKDFARASSGNLAPVSPLCVKQTRQLIKSADRRRPKFTSVTKGGLHTNSYLYEKLGNVWIEAISISS